ncbi:hypothetical protein BDA96_10G240900 [Sorghum bicolor]|uniref:Uncharacterized protein n=2 Tax=Sorghum bicolor TaxID=4558 RepID=A0A921Q3M6_SORBI|nr:hypothetical protein BDA96_10G240900 [Sorghum bicolor]OQU76671.1 hypothetical protein SORBI_3010G183350 [Sorghum bicolor]
MDFYHDQMRVIFPVAASWTSTPVADPIRSTKRCGATDRTSSRRPPMVGFCSLFSAQEILLGLHFGSYMASDFVMSV